MPIIYTPNQKLDIIQRVSNLTRNGEQVKKALDSIGINKQMYYRWRGELKRKGFDIPNVGKDYVQQANLAVSQLASKYDDIDAGKLENEKNKVIKKRVSSELELLQAENDNLLKIIVRLTLEKMNLEEMLNSKTG